MRVLCVVNPPEAFHSLLGRKRVRAHSAGDVVRALSHNEFVVIPAWELSTVGGQDGAVGIIACSGVFVLRTGRSYSLSLSVRKGDT